ncbi:MAG: hypothetical protein RI894_118 [Bacteroidota bacterium]|jgi:hypothetical protein
MAEDLLVNRVANSGLLTLNLEEWFPDEELAHFDMKNYLFMALILKEKEFREALSAHDWQQYAHKNLVLYCSADAIVPYWAFMLVAIKAAPFAKRVVQCAPEQFVERAYAEALARLDLSQYADKRIVIKGCSQKPVPISAYVELARLLTPIAKSIMYGEPCSTVPLYKQARTAV